MQCPFCGEEMERGYLKSSQRIHWGKEQKLGFIPDDIHLTKNFWQGFFEGNFVEAYYCKQCKKMIISCE